MSRDAVPPSADCGVEEAVRQRYGAAARAVEAALCCPVSYDPRYLEAIPREVLERDYGCGNPTPFVRPGDVVLDLGAGGGKVCFIAAQVVGPQGRVIGVDCNREMLELARGSLPAFAQKVGYANVSFRCGMIQDLRLDLDLLGEELGRAPVQSPWGWLEMRSLEDRLRRERPLIPDQSVSCVVSSCVLNLVRREDRRQLFREIFRVLRPAGRAAISDIVADEDVPAHLQGDPRLWSGCVSGAFREDRFLEAFEEAGFHGIEVVERQREPWCTVEGIEFRSITVLAHRGEAGPALERKQAVIYRGPFRQVQDEEGNVYPRGRRIAVSDRTFERLQREPYAGLFDTVEPRQQVPPEEAAPFDPRRPALRDPGETKGVAYRLSIEPQGSCCDTNGSCC